MSRRPDDPAFPPPRRPRAQRKDPLGPDSAVAARLRALYEEDLRAPLPGDILALLEELEKAERRGEP